MNDLYTNIISFSSFMCYSAPVVECKPETRNPRGPGVRPAPLLRSRTLPAIVAPGLSILQAQIDARYKSKLWPLYKYRRQTFASFQTKRKVQSNKHQWKFPCLQNPKQNHFSNTKELLIVFLKKRQIFLRFLNPKQNCFLNTRNFLIEFRFLKEEANIFKNINK